MVIKKINRFLDIIEGFFFSISKSYIVFIIKKLLYYIKYYLTEEDKLNELIYLKKNQIYIFYIYKIKNNIFIFLNFRILFFIFYFFKYFTKVKDILKRRKELNIFLQYIYPFLLFNVKVNFIFIIYNLKFYKINIHYKYKNISFLFKNIRNSLYIYRKYVFIFNTIIFIFNILNNIKKTIIHVYNINFILLIYFNLNKI